jgi:hypothetical protein
MGEYTREEIIAAIADEKGYFPGSFQEFVSRIWSDEPGVLYKFFGPVPNGHIERQLRVIDANPAISNNGIDQEYKKQIFIYCVGVSKRCGIFITVEGNVERAADTTDRKIERYLTGPFPDADRQKAFNLMRKIVRTLFWIGARRIGLAVGNILLERAQKNLQTRKEKDIYRSELDLTLTAVSQCIFYHTHENPRGFFEEEKPFSTFLDPIRDPEFRYCEHGVIILKEFYSDCIFEKTQDVTLRTRSCANKSVQHGQL